MLFTGNCTALVTPFTKNGTKINYHALKELIDKQIESNCSAILLLGTTGESPTITQTEKNDLLSFVVEYINHRTPLIVGAGSNNTIDAIKKSQTYQQLGADALLQVTPYYNKCTQKGLIAHYTQIADNVNIPIILYNVPSRTGVNILPQTVYQLSQHNNIVGIKEASGNIAQIEEIIRLCSPDFAIYSGDDNLTLPILSLGGKGVISVVGNIYPQIMAKLCNSYFTKNNQEAQQIQHKISPLCKTLFSEVNPIPIKTALNILGYNVGPCRLPLTSMEIKNKNLLMKTLKQSENNLKEWL